MSIALFVDGDPELISSLEEVNERIVLIKKSKPDADFEKVNAPKCSECGSAHFYERDTMFCGCLDY